ncbi:MAG: NAD-dependent epimerase/dehydratase family protein [Thermoanaerobaculum sp.]|nr:NAD-dependent epimerase/dehydratase family protein [Thermoanaerobaculum sp.]MDW7966723.1 NAD-dependent epimerase/dehydratase family protein [Thermoanaerobaculum sp.]
MRLGKAFRHLPVLVTGAGGFLGSRLAQRLFQEGAEVHACLRPGGDRSRLSDLPEGVVVHQVDLRDGEAVLALWAAVRPVYVFHAAASRGHPQEPHQRLAVLQGSLCTTANVLEAAVYCKVRRLVHLGSSLEYGWLARPIRERDPLRPNTPRGLAKAAASALVQLYAKHAGVSAVILRPFSVYGPGEAKDRFIPKLLQAAMDGKALPLAPGEVRHDFVYVEDVVEACLRAACRSLRPGTVLNVGTGRQWTLEEVVTLVESLIGKPVRLLRGAYPNSPCDASCWVADMGKTRRVLGWEPRVTLEDGLQRTLRWMQGHECGS